MVRLVREIYYPTDITAVPSTADLFAACYRDAASIIVDVYGIKRQRADRPQSRGSCRWQGHRPTAIAFEMARQQYLQKRKVRVRRPWAMFCREQVQHAPYTTSRLDAESGRGLVSGWCIAPTTKGPQSGHSTFPIGAHQPRAGKCLLSRAD